MGNGDEEPQGEKVPAIAQSGTYDQAFFLALAAKGKEVWNAWRRDNKDINVTFAGIDFSEAPRDQIDFSWFEFGANADFSRCKWRGAEHRSEAYRPGRACFTGATFGNLASFYGAEFGSHASFDGATFRAFADFGRAAFDKFATFRGTVFGKLTFFTSAAFGSDANFTAATFGEWADFGCAAFGIFASFKQTHFGGRVDFTGMSVEKRTWDLEANADKAEEKSKDWQTLKTRHEHSWILYSSGPDHFLEISFEGARFYGEANFSGRSFKGEADFINSRFYRPPGFDAVPNAFRIDFTGAYIGFGRPLRPHWTIDSKVPLGLRRLRKIAEETKNHDLERDLYIEERKAERGVYLHQLFEELKKARWIERPLITWQLVAHLFWISVMLGYLVLANYGRSFLLPLAWLGLSGYGFYWLYLWILEPITSKMGPLDTEKYKHAVRMLALGNTVPFVGPLTIDADIKKFLVCPGFGSCVPTAPEGYQLLVLSQNLLSIILVFFIGLALRNYFKIK